jgi:hypothetical protein
MRFGGVEVHVGYPKARHGRIRLLEKSKSWAEILKKPRMVKRIWDPSTKETGPMA